MGSSLPWASAMNVNTASRILMPVDVPSRHTVSGPLMPAFAMTMSTLLLGDLAIAVLNRLT